MSVGPVRQDHTAPQSQDWGRRRLRAGAAKVALDIKRKGQYAEGLRAAEMAQGHSEQTLERWARGGALVVIVAGALRPRVMSNGDRRRLGLPDDPALNE